MTCTITTKRPRTDGLGGVPPARREVARCRTTGDNWRKLHGPIWVGIRPRDRQRHGGLLRSSSSRRLFIAV